MLKCVRTYPASQTSSESMSHWHPPSHVSHPASGHSWRATWKTSTGGDLKQENKPCTVPMLLHINTLKRTLGILREGRVTVPSGMSGTGGWITVQPAFLKSSIWKSNLDYSQEDSWSITLCPPTYARFPQNIPICMTCPQFTTLALIQASSTSFHTSIF